MTARYPDIEPYDTGTLKVSEIHQLYYEQSGNKDGNPVLVVHGGPGSGSNASDRTCFDPSVYRIVMMDQRGAGKSSPTGELKENTTWDLVSDIETLREHLLIDRWVVFGGSWGSTLSLAYAETHPDRVKALILRGIFLSTRRELEWFNQNGANMLFPDAWEEYVKPIPEVERFDMISAYHRRLNGEDEKVRDECAMAWTKWETVTSRLQMDPDTLARLDEFQWTLNVARIECHYFIHGGFLQTDTQLIDDVDKIRHIPTTIIHGRYDVICPMLAAWTLHKAFPEADFHIVPDAGHSGKEPGAEKLILSACEKYKTF